MRHAKSSWRDDSLADHDRPLNKRGRQDAPRMGRLLRREDRRPDLIVTSSARRARDTAEAVAQASGYDGEIRVTRSLYGAEEDDFLAVLRGLPAEAATVLLVSHNPGLESLLAELAGQFERLPTGAVACLSLDLAAWSELSEETPARLLDVWLPRNVA
jgi:phosphohistidine phosphatase